MQLAFSAATHRQRLAAVAHVSRFIGIDIISQCAHFSIFMAFSELGRGQRSRMDHNFDWLGHVPLGLELVKSSRRNGPEDGC